MLATGFYPQHFHMPSRPSPLAERSANAAPRPFQFTMPTPAQTEKRSYTAPQRAYKPNPVVQTRDAATKRRRDMFFNRVQKERDEKKWEVRGEQIQRLDHMSEQRRWEAEQARQAPQLNEEMIEKELHHFVEPESNQDMDEADYILAQEEQAVQELIASMEAEQEDVSQNYGSDDEDYDQLFKEFAWNMPQQPLQQQQQQQQAHQGASTSGTDMDAMDMS